MLSRLSVLMLISYLFIFWIGCGADEEVKGIPDGNTTKDLEDSHPVIIYPGAPIITIEQTAFNGWDGKNDPMLHYRLKAKEPLPYDIKIRLSILHSYTVEGWLYEDVNASDERGVDEIVEMRKGRFTYEALIGGGSDKRIQNRIIEILPWQGPGDDPYNVGIPSRLKIVRQPMEGKIVPEIVSITPHTGTKIDADDIVTITFDKSPVDATVSSKFRNLQFTIEGRILTIRGFPVGCKFESTTLQITWGGGETSHWISYMIPADIDNVVTINGRAVIVLQGGLSLECPLVADYDYLLRGAVFVKSGTTLKIEPGVTIYGENATNGTLIVEQGAKIIAEGTADAPIVMTSDAAIGSRARGQWGGLIINGRAPTNQGITFGEGDTGVFGGHDIDDNSGVLRYVRIEYAGIEFSPDNELNGLSLQGVGSGTVIEYVQVHMCQDDGIEVFGGTVNIKYALVTGARDDSFDWTDGWTGKGQFWVAQHYGDDADNGFENDNSSKNNEATPRSAPTIFNVTLVGDPNGPESDNGMLIREGAAGMYANFIVVGFNKVGLDVNNESSHKQADDGGLIVKNSIFFSNGAGNFGDEKDDDGFDEAAWAKRLGNKENDPKLTDPFNKDNPNFIPRVRGIVPVAIPPADGFFEHVDFIGGVSPFDDWTKGWTTSRRN